MLAMFSKFGKFGELIYVPVTVDLARIYTKVDDDKGE